MAAVNTQLLTAPPTVVKAPSFVSYLPTNNRGRRTAKTPPNQKRKRVPSCVPCGAVLRRFCPAFQDEEAAAALQKLKAAADTVAANDYGIMGYSSLLREDEVCSGTGAAFDMGPK